MSGTITAFAEETTATQNITTKDDLIDNINSDTDSSEIEVRVVKQKGDDQITIFTGKLKDYDNGKWISIDFSDIQFFVLLDWDSMESEAIYIVPLTNDTEIENNTDISKPSDESVNETLSNGTALASQINSIQCDVNLMYDGTYSEKLIIRNKQLTVPVEITNNGSTDKNIVCYIAEYDENGVLRNTISGSTVTVEAGKSIATQVTKVFSSETKSVKIFVWDSESLQPITGAIILDENESDYYANSAIEAQEYDVDYQIKGKINTASDVDYIKFVPKTSGEYTFNCVSATNAVTTLYNSNQGTLKSASSSYKYSLTEKQTYYLKVTGNIGEYVLSVQYNVPSEADSFDVYKFDVDTNIYKKSIKETCDDLCYSDKTLAKQMYDEYEDILGDDAKLHRLPDFLSGHPKDLSNFDTLLNQYYSTKYSDFMAIKQRYIDLIDRYAELANNSSSAASSSVILTDDETAVSGNIAEFQDEAGNSENISDDEPYPIIGKYVPQAKQREDIGMVDIRPGDEIQSTVTPSLTIVSKTATSVTYNATFPISGRWGNIIRIIDFNTSTGLTIEKNQYGNDEYRPSGQQTITGLSPGGIYIIGMWWSTDGEWTGGENSIYRFVQLPNNTTESLATYTGGRVTAKLEAADKALASSSDFNTWISRMDKAYNAYKDLTGYTPYNSKKIEMRSTRDNLNDYMGITDGHNYWTVIFGYYTGGSTVFNHAKAFYQGHMRRLSQGDWGDTPMHELSHVFDNYKWNFDAETLAQLKLYYVIEQLNAKVYRPERYENNSGGWYTKSNYYDLLKHDRYLDGYDDSFGKGTYSSEGFASILIDIEKEIGWNPFKKTFRYFSSLSYRQLPDDDGGTLKLFLTKLKDYSGVDVLSYISSRDTRIIESHFGISLDYVDPVYPTVSGGSGGGGRSEVNTDKGNYSVFEFKPTESANYYIYTSPYAGSGVSNDTYIEVYTNANLSGTPIASNDDYDGGRFSKVSIAATENTTYYIKVRHYASGQLHAELNITKDAPVQLLTLDSHQDIITSSGEFALFSFTPDKVGAYSFEVGNYNGGTTAYDTYIKLSDNISMTKRLGNGDKKIIANLKAGHTYYLQFSGFLMKYARGRINLSQGQTLQFTKRSDSSFIYVNSPEYITRIDIVDDECHSRQVNQEFDIQPYMKIFEQENVTGKNTYYQTHTAWWGAKPQNYEPISSFYMDIDFYNPTSNDITVSINNLAYGTEYDVLENYYNGNGISVNIPIPAHEHRLLFEYLDAPLIMSYPGTTSGDGWDWNRHRSPIILFDFQVISGNLVISSLAAYDNRNLYLRTGSKNIIDVNGAVTENGEIISELSKRANETDLYGKYKGIAKNQSAWINANLEFVIDNLTMVGEPLPINLKDEQYPNGVANPKTWWMTNINPLSDEWNGLIYGMPGNEHRFTYHCADGGVWNFAYDYRDLRDINENAVGNISRNNPVPESILENAALDVAKGQKEHFTGSPDTFALGMGSWGVTYHYTISVKNDTNSEKEISYQAKTFDNMIFGYKTLTDNVYETRFIPNIGNNESDWTSLKSVRISPNQSIVFEIVTMLGGGHGGTNNRIIVN